MSKDDKNINEKGQFVKGNTACTYWTEERAQDLLQKMGDHMIKGIDFEDDKHNFRKNTTVESYYAKEAVGFVKAGAKNWWINPEGEKVRTPVTKHTVQKIKVKFPKFAEGLTVIRAIEKFKLTQGTLNGELKEAAAIFYLKCHHDMREAEKAADEDDEGKDVESANSGDLAAVAALPDRD